MNWRGVLCSVCTIVCVIVCGCTSGKVGDSQLVFFDTGVVYPEKEIRLEDVADIEYLQLETHNDFLVRGPSYVIASNKIFNTYNGDILCFSRDGRPLSKFNRVGGGPQDYASLHQLVYDETSDELFVRAPDRIVVYSSAGAFKRVIHFHNRLYRGEIVNFDSRMLLFYDDEEVYSTRFSFISKEDGKVLETLDLPKDKKVNLFISRTVGNAVYVSMRKTYPIVRHPAGYLLTDYVLDTVYLLSHERKLSPILLRAPKIQSMDPVVYLNSFVEAGNYHFVSAVTVKEEKNQLPEVYLMRDKNTGTVYRQKITLNDYQGKTVNLSPATMGCTQDGKLGLIVLDLTELQDANSANKLSGKLKTLVENANDDGNDIFMILHFK